MRRAFHRSSQSALAQMLAGAIVLPHPTRTYWHPDDSECIKENSVGQGMKLRHEMADYSSKIFRHWRSDQFIRQLDLLKFGVIYAVLLPPQAQFRCRRKPAHSQQPARTTTPAAR